MNLFANPFRRIALKPGSVNYSRCDRPDGSQNAAYRDGHLADFSTTRAPGAKKLFVVSKNSLRAGDDVYTVSPCRLPVAFDEVHMDLALIREVN